MATFTLSIHLFPKLSSLTEPEIVPAWNPLLLSPNDTLVELSLTLSPMPRLPYPLGPLDSADLPR
jgi:hypothetical protein